MAAPDDLVKLSEVRDTTDVSIHSLATLIEYADLAGGTKYRNSFYFRRDQIPTRDEIVAAARAALIRELEDAAAAADRVRVEYEAAGNDARDALESLAAGETPLRLGPDLSADASRAPSLKSALEALTFARLGVSILHRVVVELATSPALTRAS